MHDVLVLFICSFANSYILFSSSRHCWPNMLPSCQTWELMELKSMDYENKVKTARSVLWSLFLLDCKFNSASWDIELPFSSILRMPMIFFRRKKSCFSFKPLSFITASLRAEVDISLVISWRRYSLARSRFSISAGSQLKKHLKVWATYF